MKTDKDLLCSMLDEAKIPYGRSGQTGNYISARSAVFYFRSDDSLEDISEEVGDGY